MIDIEYHKSPTPCNEFEPHKRRREQPERQVQRAVLDRLAWCAPAGVTWFHIPNGGYRKPVEAAIMSGLGVVAGMPDLCILHNGRAFFLELKADGGRLSPIQKECHERLRQAGAVVMTADGIDAAVSALQNIGILPEARR
jgi:hypothetical protein